MSDRRGYSTAKIVRATTATAFGAEDWKRAWELAAPVVVAAGRFLDVEADPDGTPRLREDAHFQLLAAVTQYVADNSECRSGSVSGRPDDLLKRARECATAWQRAPLGILIDRLADALEAAQKERDALRERLGGSVEAAFNSESGWTYSEETAGKTCPFGHPWDVNARVRQLEEAYVAHRIASAILVGELAGRQPEMLDWAVKPGQQPARIHAATVQIVADARRYDDGTAGTLEADIRDALAAKENTTP